MVCCLSDKEIWTCGHNNNLIRLYDLEGELQTDIPTNSGHMSKYIAMLKNNGKGYLVYIDCSDRIVNIVKSVQVHEMIILEYWNHIAVCGTTSGDFLVIMISDLVNCSSIYI